MDFINKFFKKVLKRNDEVCGIDIGSSVIKVASAIRTVNNGIKFTRYASCPTPSATIKDGAIVDAQTLGDTIRDLLTRYNFPKDIRIVSSISGQSVVIRPIKMTQMSKVELAGAIKFQAGDYLPYSVDDAQVNGIILRESLPDSPKQMEVLLVAAPQEMLTNARELIQMAAGGTPVVDLEPLVLLRAFNESNRGAASEDKTIALVNLGASFSSVNIFKAGLLRQSRAISVAGNSFTKAISKSLNMSFEEAEKFKLDKCVIRVEGDSSPIAPTAMRAFNIIKPVLADLVRDIQRSFDYYRSREQSESIDLVILSGGTARMKNIDVYLTKELSIECQIANPFRNASIENVQGIGADELEALAPMAMVVTGLALRED
ncbi:type IV pilus assembly protein PilM [bacterium]|nr:type IV pilus assembly protein PilM [bacterium]